MTYGDHSNYLSTRAHRRGAVIIVWLALAGFVWITASTAGERDIGATGALCLIVGSLTMALLSRSVGFNAPEHELDERELAERDRTHVRAYRILAYAMMIPMAYALIALKMGLWLPSTPRGIVGSFVATIAAVGLVPLSMLAWDRADGRHDEEDLVHAATIRPSKRFPVRSPGRQVMFGLFALSASLFMIRLSGGTVFSNVSAATIAGFAAALGLSLLVTRTEK